MSMKRVGVGERLHALTASLMCALALGCQGDSASATAVDHAASYGGDDDPVVKMARDALGNTDTLSMVFTNGTSYPWAEGLITIQPAYATGQAPSSALATYLAGGDATALATALGYHLGLDAYLVPALAAGGRTSMIVSVPEGSLVSYAARVSGTQDFVGLAYMQLSNTGGSPKKFELQGFSVSGGTVVQNNQSVGPNPSGSSIRASNQNGCKGGNWAESMNLFTDDFTQGLNDSSWPMSNGYAFDFGGDWYTDGSSALVYNPNWGGAGPGATAPTTTGFVKFVSVCAGNGSTVSVTGQIRTAFTDFLSDTTLVVYFFDNNSRVISVVTNTPAKGAFTKSFSVFGATIPSGTKRIAIVPMAYISGAEQGTVYYEQLSVSYEPPGAFASTAIGTESFSTFTGTERQPTGWVDSGGDWFIDGPLWATLWNPVNGGNAYALPPVTATLSKSFALGAYTAGDVVSARLFGAATFADPTSFVKVQLVFNTGTTVESSPQGRGWGNVDVWRQAIPSGATSVQVVVSAYLGPAETSSLYVDNLSLSVLHPQL